MPNAILLTKLLVPPPRPGLVLRPHLLARLDAGLDRPLTLLSAPAGSGKTTLLSAWLAALTSPKKGTQRPAPRVAWVSLDSGDSDLGRFLTYIATALQSGAELRSLLRSPQPPVAEAFLTLLINELASCTDPVVLVLDDYHTITAPAIHEALSFLLQHAPTSLHVVIATRIDPPLPLAQLRARDQINELRGVDLQFTLAEAGDFLQRLTGAQLTPARAAVLNERVEGWAVGLQLAGLSLRGRSPEQFDRLVAGFSGRQHFVFDYLADEVLGRQPPDVQDFLLRTAIPERLCAPLADALLADDGTGGVHRGDAGADRRTSQAILEELEHRNLFLAPLDDSQQWYRYHHLFRDLLLARLSETRPDAVPALQRRAATWFVKNGFVAEAVEHGLAAGGYAFVADAIEGWFRGVAGWTEVSYATFLRWIAALPEDLVRRRWMLRLLASRITYVRGDTRRALRELDALEADLAAEPEDPSICMVLDLIPADRASYALLRGELRTSIEFGRKLLAGLAPENHVGRARALALIAMAELRLGAMIAADEHFGAAAEEARHSPVPSLAVPFVASRAEARFLRGRLAEADEFNRRALELGRQGDHELPVAGFAHLGLAKTLYERNDLPAAEERARAGLHLLGQGGITEAFGNGFGLLALILQAAGDAAGAAAAAERAVYLAETTGLPRTVREAGAYRVRIWLAQGQPERAESWPEYIVGLDVGEALAEFEELALAWLLLCQGKAEQALALCERLEREAAAAGRHGRALVATVQRALALDALGRTAAALDALEDALARAEAEGYVRLFLDGGPQIYPLLHRLAAGRPVSAFACRLLAASGQGSVPVPGAVGRATPTLANLQGLLAPSERELAVLRLLQSDLSVPEIAAQLVVAPSTIRSHVKHLYEILGVHSRFEAISRARDLGLIP